MASGTCLSQHEVVTRVRFGAALPRAGGAASPSEHGGAREAPGSDGLTGGGSILPRISA